MEGGEGEWVEVIEGGWVEGEWKYSIMCINLILV